MFYRDALISVALFISVFLAVVFIIMAVAGWLAKSSLKKRLSQVFHTSSKEHPKPVKKALHHWIAGLETISTLFFSGEIPENAKIHLKLLQAGMRDVNAARNYYASKIILMAALPIFIFPLLIILHVKSIQLITLTLVFFSLAGYYLPNSYLNKRIKQRLKDVQEGLPDLIDLLVICTESGLALESAFLRVAKELGLSHPHLAEEIYFTNLEVKAGVSRNTALKNLEKRLDLEGMHSLVFILTQADRFGTSVSEALRTEAETMRIRRMQIAEEIAARIPVKVLIPMIFCIFPALLIVLVGPAVMHIRDLFK